MAVIVIFAVAIFGGMGITFFSGLRMSAEERFFGGWVVGIVAFTTIGMVTSRLFNVSGPTTSLTALVLAGIGAAGWRSGIERWTHEWADIRARVKAPLRSGQNPAVLVLLCLPLWAILCRIFFLAYQVDELGAIWVGHLASYSDWQAHLAYTGSFVYGQNTALDLPLAAGYNIGYHAGINYFAALLVTAGASLEQSLQISSAFAACALPGVIYSVGQRVFTRQAIAVVGTLLFMTFGGWGWYTLFLKEDLADKGISVLGALPRTYTRAPDAADGTIVMENPVVGHLFPQRPTAIGFSLVLLILWWAASAYGPARAGLTPGEDEASVTSHRGLLFCGVLLGLTPFFNLFAFGTPLAFIGFWWLATRFDRRWLTVLVPAVVLALPMVVFLQPPSSTLELPYDWVGHMMYPAGIPADRGIIGAGTDWFGFWARNMGLFLPLLAASMVIPGIMKRSTAIALAPIWLFFVVPNLVKPHPWNGNNTHYFIFVILLGALPVAALLVRLGSSSWLAAILAGGLFATMSLAGTLDLVAAADSTRPNWPVLAMDSAAVSVGEWSRSVDSGAVFLVEPPIDAASVSGHLHPVTSLSGHDVVTSFDGWVFDLGIPDWSTRKEASRLILEASPGFEDLLEQYDVDYVVTGPSNRTPGWEPNTQLWEEYGHVVYRHAGWTVYRV